MKDVSEEKPRRAGERVIGGRASKTKADNEGILTKEKRAEKAKKVVYS